VRDRNRADLELAAILLARRSRLRRVHAKRKVAIAATVAVVLLTVAVVSGAATGRAVLLGSCNLNALQPVALGQNSFVYADNGTLLGVVPSSVNREPLRLAQDRCRLQALILRFGPRGAQGGARPVELLARATV